MCCRGVVGHLYIAKIVRVGIVLQIILRLRSGATGDLSQPENLSSFKMLLLMASSPWQRKDGTFHSARSFISYSRLPYMEELVTCSYWFASVWPSCSRPFLLCSQERCSECWSLDLEYAVLWNSWLAFHDQDLDSNSRMPWILSGHLEFAASLSWVSAFSVAFSSCGSIPKIGWFGFAWLRSFCYFEYSFDLRIFFGRACGLNRSSLVEFYCLQLLSNWAVILLCVHQRRSDSWAQVDSNSVCKPSYFYNGSFSAM